MKQFTSFFATAIFIVGAMLLGGCKGDPGPQGPPGVGSDVFEGFAEGIKCASCHNPDIDTTYFIAGRAYQWAQSKHANGGDIERNGPSCAGCHTTEGFMQRMNGQTVTAQLVPSPPGCFACHSRIRGRFLAQEGHAGIDPFQHRGRPERRF